MGKRKTKKKIITSTSPGIKNMILSSIFILLGVISLFSEVDSDLGSWCKMYLSFLLGDYYQFYFSPIILITGILGFFKEGFRINFTRIIGLLLYIFASSSLIGIIFNYKNDYYFDYSMSLIKFLGFIPTLIFLIILLLFGLFLIFRISYKKIIKKIMSKSSSISNLKDKFFEPNLENDTEDLKKGNSKKNTDLEKLKELEEKVRFLEKEKHIKKPKQLNLDDTSKKENDGIIHVPILKKENKKSIVSSIKNTFSDKSENNTPVKNKYLEKKYNNWVLPGFELLSDVGGKIEIDNNDIYKKQTEIIDKLRQFKINVNITDYRVGPTVIQFRLKPEEGIKLNKIENLKKDLTLALEAKSIRIQAPIPGEGVVGIEVPNENRQIVGLREVISSNEFNNPKLDIPIAIGKDVSGDIIVGDLTKMPHLLVAGQTASGKSVGMNGFIISMLYTFSPSELKLIMIDPKRVELSIYNGIPHLLTPVITNPDKALNSLKWVVAEMLRRYDLATKVNARNFKEYNKKTKEKLPYIVIVIDELADLMMSGSKKEVEGSIARIAQMARAVGMHLIVATQRPSVDVITGLIKANIPSRISFTVASQIDSRTILDKIGAEDLLGRGDMLYSPTGVLEALRVQGVLVETNEVEDVVNKLKLTIDPDMLKNLYDDSIVNGKPNSIGSILENYTGDQEEDPEIIEKAIEVVKESKKGSTSLLQRKLGLGYARAAKVIDILEEMGIVGPANGSKPRDVNV